MMARMWLYPYMNMNILPNGTTIYFHAIECFVLRAHINISHIIVNARSYIANFENNITGTGYIQQIYDLHKVIPKEQRSN